MKLAVLGSTGRTGKLVVQHALDRGHHVKALGRRAESITIAHPHLAIVQADAHDTEAIDAALTGCDAVVSALGIGASRKPTTVYSDGARNVLTAMASHHIDRLAVISASPAGERSDQPLLDRRVMMPILDLFFGTSYQDMRRMEALLSASDVNWISLRPPRLLDRPRTGAYRIQPDLPLPKARQITFSDLAMALLDVLDRPELYRHVCSVAN
ncbi:MAG: SDR family oxidoreductase [Actinomycetota bacterium]|nr:SDR family oxidoreductase [Actinomycetota bacterium]